jgi:phosphoesterase RecJ-like protein
MVILPEFHTGYIYLSAEELKRFHFVMGDTEGFVNYPLSVKGVHFSALFIEREGFIKTSFRSKGNFPANLFSQRHFNGGGHLNAAGGQISLPMNQALSLFHSLLPEYKTSLSNSAND